MKERFYKPYFENKNCSICKGRAKKYRFIGGKGYFLCASEKCDIMTLVKAGWKKPEEIDLEKYK